MLNKNIFIKEDFMHIRQSYYDREVNVIITSYLSGP